MLAVTLPDAMTRCRPGGVRKAQCARFVAPLPAKYGTLEDFNLRMSCTICPHFISLDAARELMAAKPEQAVKPWPGCIGGSV